MPFVVLWAQESLTTNLTRRTPPTAQPASTPEEVSNWLTAVHAADAKKATGVLVLDLREITSFTDFFVLCSTGNPRQARAVADEVHKQLKEIGELPVSMEGHEQGEWILLDYGDFLVHIFSGQARAYYDLERLWRHAKTVPVAELQSR